MFLSATFLLVSAVALITMVLFRVWELRVGRLTVKEEDIPEDFFSHNRAEEALESFFRKANIFSYHATALSISHFIVFLREVRDSASKEWKKFSARLPSHLPHRSQGSSFFLKDISAHKEEFRRENGYHE